MMKNIVIISTSLRKGGNSEILAKEFMRGATESGHNVNFITLQNKEIKFCIGCLSCQSTGRCVLKDDMPLFLDKIYHADVLVFATPIYYYEMSGQMKTFIDRCNPLFSSDYKFRSVYLLATAAENEESALDGAIKGLNGFIKCFDKSKLSGIVAGIDTTNVGDVVKHQDLMIKAYNEGKNC